MIAPHELPSIFMNRANQLEDRLIALARHMILNGIGSDLAPEDQIPGEEIRTFSWNGLVVWASAHPFSGDEKPKFRYFHLVRINSAQQVKLIVSFDGDLVRADIFNKKLARDVCADLSRLTPEKLAKLNAEKTDCVG